MKINRKVTAVFAAVLMVCMTFAMAACSVEKERIR